MLVGSPDGWLDGMLVGLLDGLLDGLLVGLDVGLYWHTRFVVIVHGTISYSYCVHCVHARQLNVAAQVLSPLQSADGGLLDTGPGVYELNPAPQAPLSCLYTLPEVARPQ